MFYPIYYSPYILPYGGYGYGGYGYGGYGYGGYGRRGWNRWHRRAHRRW